MFWQAIKGMLQKNRHNKCRFRRSSVTQRWELPDALEHGSLGSRCLVWKGSLQCLEKFLGSRTVAQHSRRLLDGDIEMRKQ